MRVKPAPGINVRDPISLRHLPEEGKDVPENTYWKRRIKSGDVVLCTESVLSSQTSDYTGEF